MAMDLDTAKKQRRRLQTELNALGTLGETALSFTRTLIAMEIFRLDPQIAGENLEAQVQVEDSSMVRRVSNDFSLKTISSAVEFKDRLSAELHELKKFQHEFPFTILLIQRVIECMEEEIVTYGQRQYAEFQLRNGANDQPEINNERSLPEVEWMPVPRSRLYNDNLNKCIKEAINKVLEKKPEGASSDDVLDILRINPTIQVDYHVRSFVRQRFFELHTSTASQHLQTIKAQAAANSKIDRKAFRESIHWLSLALYHMFLGRICFWYTRKPLYSENKTSSIAEMEIVT